jgi:hypothetical protein
MKVRDIKDVRDLQRLDTNDVVELLDELRMVASKSASDLLGQGRTQARRALGVPGEGAVAWALIGGLMLGVIVGAAFALLWAPFTGGEARKRLSEQVERARERVPQMARGGNGRSVYSEPPLGTAEPPLERSEGLSAAERS